MILKGRHAICEYGIVGATSAVIAFDWGFIGSPYGKRGWLVVNALELPGRPVIDSALFLMRAIELREHVAGGIIRGITSGKYLRNRVNK